MTADHYTRWGSLIDYDKMPAAVANLWKLGPAGLDEYIMANVWFVEADDLIGGWVIVPLPFPPSSGVPEIASFIRKANARYIASLHNQQLFNAEQKPSVLPGPVDGLTPPSDWGSVSDGLGSEWPKCMPNCGLEVVRPGKVQCYCDDDQENS